MDLKKKMLLQTHQHDIIEDLDVKYVLDELFTKNVVSSEDIDYIVNLNSRADKTRYLLDKMIQSGTNENYLAFVDTLAKDYHWLWQKLVNENVEPMLNDSLEDSLSRGDVPRLPQHYVRRTALEQTVKEKLQHLTRHNFLVLHGMSGSGKTSIVTSVLRENSELITNNFNGVVFWLNFSKCKTEDDIVAQQNKLYRKATSHLVPHSSYMNSTISISSIGSNADSHSLSSYDWSWQELKDRLKTIFSEQAIKDSLLVLDEVNDKKCVEAFDIGCKIVITTGDTEVASNLRPQIVKVENSFTERETLEFFASCLDVSVNQLPRQAKKLHDNCKGSVFLIILIGAQLVENKERLNDDPRRWKDYLHSPEKKFFLLPRNHNNNPMNTIEMCINSLSANILPLFKMLCILPDNAKVSAKVLSKLWDKEVAQVEAVMKQLRSKSLIIEFYDSDHKNYMYEVHDLIMNYLRTCLNEDDVKKLHAQLLKSYNYDLINPPLEIVDDGYFAFYVGYHILNTKNLNNTWQLFNKLYMNLLFLGNKVRLTGPADVILDLQKYESHIFKDDFDRELLYSVRAFLSAHGIDLHRYSHTDIVQSILQHETKGCIYTKALQVAQERCNKNELYFEFSHEHNVEELKPSNIDVKENITSVCFLGDYAVVGTMNGLVKFFQISTNKLKKELTGTESGIKWVGACPSNPPIVAALCYDGVIKVWYIDDVEQDDEVIEEEPEESYNNNYPSNVTIQPKRGPCISCRWANNEETLITHTAKLIILYTPTGEVLSYIDVYERDHREILCCIPCNYDRTAIVATSNGMQFLECFDLTTKERVLSFEENDVVLDILTVPGTNRVVTLKAKEVTEHELKLKLKTDLKNNCNMCRSKKVISVEDIKDSLTFMSMVVNKAGTLLFVSTDDGRVICVELKTNSRVFDLENRRGKVVTMAMSEVCDDFMPGSDVLLTGTGTIEDSVKVWYLDSSYVSLNTRNGKVRLTTKFDASFVSSLSPQAHTPHSTPANGAQKSTTPKRHQSFVNYKEVEKKVAKKTMSLDRHNLKPLVLKGICNGNGVEENAQPLLAVVDDNNHVQIMRGSKILTEIPSTEQISTVKISPCNQYILYGTKSGHVNKYTLRTKESKTIMDVYSPVQYLNFVTCNLLMVAGKNRCFMAYKMTDDGVWKPYMLQAGNTHLGSQEILNDIQGKRRGTPYDRLSSSESESSLTSRDRLFPNGDRRRLSKPSGLAQCFWADNVGLLTVEHYATIKLWNQDLKLATVLYGRQADVNISCAAFRNNVLAICDDNRGFQTFELKEEGDQMELQMIQEYKLNNRIICCDLSADGHLLALGLDSGDVVIWNVPSKRQRSLLKHHKSKVRYCSFSPVPERLFRSSAVNSPSGTTQSPCHEDDDQPPLVLVTMASEIVWWNVTHLMKMKAKQAHWRLGRNVVTPIPSPMDRGVSGSELTLPMEKMNLSASSHSNFFFGDGLGNSQECWKDIWKKKKYKEGAKRKEILACIKLSGMNAKKLCHDDKFSCFVTVDSPGGHIHIMNVMRPNS